MTLHTIVMLTALALALVCARGAAVTLSFTSPPLGTGNTISGQVRREEGPPTSPALP